MTLDSSEAGKAVLVLGMHRSGTSAMAGALSALGVRFGDDLLPAQPCNPKGIWEQRAAVALNDRLLADLNLAWHVPSPLPAGWQEAVERAGYRHELEGLVAEELSPLGLWGLKDPRLSRLLPFWLPALREAGQEVGCVVMWRDPEEVAASLYRRDLLPASKTYLLWLLHTLEAERHSRGLPRRLVRFDDLLRDGANTLEAVFSGLGLDSRHIAPEQWTRAAGYLEPGLRHGAPGDDLGRRPSAEVVEWAEAVAEALQAVAAGDDAGYDTLDQVCRALGQWFEGEWGRLARQRERGVDVVMPVYRGRAETQAAISSVLATKAADVELIVVDDASPEPGLAADLDRLAAAGAVRLVRNEENRGFAASVNRGLAVRPDRDAVVLNSDTRVAGDWLRRLRDCAYADLWVGTVTPFSNNATICSYPRFCESNPLPAGWTLEALDGAFREANAGRLLDIPTAVGFCLYLRRDCWDDVGGLDAERYEAGYGEENDLSLTAFKRGWRNVLCADTFVYHAGAVSFAERETPLKAEATRVLEERHPDYTPRVTDFIERDPVAPLRRRVDWQRAHRSQADALAVMEEWARALDSGRQRLDRHIQAERGLEQRLQARTEEARGLRRELAQRVGRLRELREENGRLQKDLADHRAVVAEKRRLQATLAVLRRSRSWRFTRPIRKLLGHE